MLAIRMWTSRHEVATHVNCCLELIMKWVDNKKALRGMNIRLISGIFDLRTSVKIFLLRFKILYSSFGFNWEQWSYLKTVQRSIRTY